MLSIGEINENTQIDIFLSIDLVEECLKEGLN